MLVKMNEDTKRIFSRQLKKARHKRNMSQDELAKQIGVSITTIQKFEYGLTSPKLHNFIALSKALNVTLDYLALGK